MMVHNSENVIVEAMQVVGANLGMIVSTDPNNARAEIGILLLDSRGCAIRGNTVTSINTGIFLRGGTTTGNRVDSNTVTGGPNAANNSFGICCNPAVGEGEAGPTGNVITNNHVARYHNTIQINGNSPGNFFKGNTLAYFDNAHIFAGNEKDMLPQETVIADDLAFQLTP
jgi:parallel beta-helix repeat protein